MSRLLIVALLATVLGCAGGTEFADSSTVAPVPAPAVETPAPTPAAEGKVALYWEEAIPADALQGRSLRELSLMRNTIYARTGHTFHTAWLAEYFAGQPWYEAKETPDLTLLTDADKKNAEAIGKAELALTKEQLQAQLAAIQSAQASGGGSEHDETELRLLSKALGKWVGAEGEQKRSPLEDPSQLERLLTLDDLEHMSRRDLRLTRNTIYARRGREFRSEVLQMHFYDTDWYDPVSDYTDARLTGIDDKNIRLVLSVEEQHGGPLMEWEHKEQIGFWYGA